MTYQTPTPSQRLLSAADGIRQIAQTLERDPVRAREVLTAMSGHIQWIADGLDQPAKEQQL